MRAQGGLGICRGPALRVGHQVVGDCGPDDTTRSSELSRNAIRAPRDAQHGRRRLPQSRTETVEFEKEVHQENKVWTWVWAVAFRQGGTHVA